MGLVPFNTLVERHSRTPEDVQGTPNGQVHFTLAANMDLFQVL